MPRKTYAPRGLPADWHPDLIADPYLREEYEFLASFRMTPERIIEQLGIPLVDACKLVYAARRRAERRERIAS
ncbi:hypothetical protein SEA_VERITY_74 [Gordonia phage Verity]|uniref:Helix-turn-helix DNA binding domain protein n=1 Tax=Gordonia phage Verity TaxID=2591211 RepID=A0A514DIV8_9CAUD|nr:hypothetical protein J1776_gp74 [Gordonia phage Verity]QDH93560.1 hypothetical protein SEA_VERITY_74 [Gordonia phage Verity]QPO16917.1 hypothetical protein SEA_DELREY21_74 [Gordonia phage Delrey21]QXN74200.1 helix-turn-helix DNA binding domain protein [Gordonia phage DoctorFroggo]